MSVSFVRCKDIMLAWRLDLCSVCYSIGPPRQWKVERLKLGDDVAVAREVST